MVNLKIFEKANPRVIFIVATALILILVIIAVILLYNIYVSKEKVNMEGLASVNRIDSKKAIILHGWGAAPELHWFPREKDILEDMGFDVSLPRMPDNYNPNEKRWLNILEDFQPTEESVLIGHSLGGTTILEYLENSETKVGTVVLVATPIECTDQLGGSELKGFKLYLENVATGAFLKAYKYDEIYDWAKIKQSANRFVLIYKSNDIRVPKVQGEFLAGKLGAELIIVPGTDHGHDFDLDIINRAISEQLVSESEQLTR